MAWRNEREQSIECGLQAASSACVETGKGRWRIELANGSTTAAVARLSGEWLELNAHMPAGWLTREHGVWPLLQFNALCDGPARLVLDRRAPRVDLRADLFVEDESNLDRRVADLCEDLRSAVHALQAGPDVTAPRPDATSPSRVSLPDLAQLCADAGWPGTERAPGDLAVVFDTAAGSFTARLAFAGRDRLTAVVDLADATAFAPASRHAAGVLLLRASALVRSVKGLAVRSAEMAETLCLAVVADDVTTGAIHRALSALAVGVDLVAREAQALQHEPLARAYLEMTTQSVESTTQHEAALLAAGN